MKAYMFPGQGSQAKGMGGALFERYGHLTRVADDILGYSIQRLCLDDPDGKLKNTQYTQPALYVVNALTYLDVQESDPVPPDYLAGHSLGEYNALLAAGAFDFATGLRLVKRRGELMARAADGAMAAVLNLEPDTIAALLQDSDSSTPGAPSTIDIANFNSPTQTVLSGPRQAIAAAQELFTRHGAMYIPLNVSAAFHSRYMRDAEQSMAPALANVSYAPLRIPVIANVSARPYRHADIESNLRRQISAPVQWLDTVRYLMGLGVTEFREIGPGNVLTKLANVIRRRSTPLVVPAAEPAAEPLTADAPPRAEPPARAAPPAQTTPAARPAQTTPAPRSFHISPETLGSPEFREDYGVRYAYVAGAMVKGIASTALVVRMARAGMLSYFGTGGLRLPAIEQAIHDIQRQLSPGQPYGMNLLCNLGRPDREMDTVDLFLRHGIHNIEAAAYIQATPALVKYRLQGLTRTPDGRISARHRVLAKVSRPEVAEVFLSPPDERIVQRLLASGAITPDQAALAPHVPLADDLCVESDSGGHTDMGVMTVQLPTIARQRDIICAQRGYERRVRVGAAGGIGTPEAAVAALLLGADFLLTGSINQCTVEGGTSDMVKDMLADMNVQDTDYAPAGDMFEIGARVQVLRRGVLFPARANKLYDLWRMHGAWHDIDPKTRDQIEGKHWGRSFDDVWRETAEYYGREMPQQVDKAERNPKHKMALVFRWYFVHTMRLALAGDPAERVNYQVHTGPAMGAFNQWVKGTGMEDWRKRHVDHIGEQLMRDTAALLGERLGRYGRASP